jgi:hypothetical protein
MTEFVHTILAFPTVIFTALLGMLVIYWAMVIIGALDVDALDGSALDGAAEGAAEAAGEAAGEAAAEAVAEAVGEAAAEGISEAAAEAATEAAHEAMVEGAQEAAAEHGGGASALAALLTALRLRNAPLTIVISFFTIFGWILTIAGTKVVTPWLGAIVPGWVAGALVLLLALIVSWPLVSLVTKPLGKIFVIVEAPKRAGVIGKVCTITTGRVDVGFGQAEQADGGAGLLIQVRCDRSEGLKKGDQALIVSYDDEREAFVVEPYDKLLKGSK